MRSALSTLTGAWMFMAVAPVCFFASPRKRGEGAISRRNLHRQRFQTLYEARIDPLGFADHVDVVETLENLFPNNLELEFSEPQADAAMDAEAEGKMRARPGAVDDEIVGPFDRLFVAVARDVPHHDLVTLLDLLAAELEIGQRGAAHMCQRRLPADHLGHEAVEQGGVLTQLAILFGMLAECVDRARHGVARGVVAADDQKD